MNPRFEFPWHAAPHDGASAPIAFPLEPDRSESENENDELFQAWCRERHESIELRLCLDEAVHLLRRILSEGTLTPARARRAKILIREIEAKRPADAGEFGSA